MNIEIDIDDVYNGWEGTDEKFILDAYEVCRNPDIDTLLDKACNIVQTDVYNWVIDNYEDDLYNYIIAERASDLEDEFSLKNINSMKDYLLATGYGSFTLTEENLADIIEDLWRRKESLLFKDVENIKLLLTKEGFI